MTPFIHKATIWTQGNGLDIYARPIWNAPIVVDCRWEDVATTYTDANGDKQRSNSRVYIDRPASVGDFIAKGDFSDVSPYPEPVETAKEIRDFRTISNVHGTRTEYRALI